MSIELMMPSNCLILSRSHLLLLLLFSCSVVSDSLRPHGLQHYQASLSFTISWSLLKPMSIEWMTPSNHLILCRPLFFMLSVFPTTKVFSSESVLRIRWPKYWSFSFNLSPSSEYLGLISFRIDWLDLLAVQGTDSQECSPTPQFRSINSSVLSFLYGPTLTSTHDHWKNYCLLCSHTAMYICYHQVTRSLQTCSFYSKLHLKKKVLDSIKPRQLRVRGVSKRASE